MTFTTIALQNDRTLVRGTDIAGAVGETILDSSQWAELKQRELHMQAHDAYDAAVEAFYAPLVEAAAKVEGSFAPVQDPLSIVVLDEGTEAVQGQAAVVVKLTHDSQVLRLLEQGGSATDRLLWVNDSLEITAYVAPAVPSEVFDELSVPQV